MKKILILGFLLISEILKAQSLDNEHLIDLIQSQKYKESIAYLNSVYPSGTDDPKIISRLAYCNLMSGNLPEAERNYIQLHLRDSTNQSVLFNLAGINLRRGNYPKASLYYEEILKMDSLNFQVYKQLAFLAQKMGQDDGVLIYLNKANFLNPLDPDVAFDYSTILKTAGNLGKADSVIQTALVADSLNLVLIKARMDICYRQKKYPDALNLGLQAVNMGDSDGQTLNLIALSNYHLEAYQKSIEFFDILDKTDLSNETTFYYTAMAYGKLGNYAKSEEYLNKSIEKGISENISLYYQQLGMVNEKLKKYEKGILAYKKAYEYGKKNSSYYSLARIYDAFVKDPATAKKYYQLYIENYKGEQNEKDLYSYSLNRLKELKK